MQQTAPTGVTHEAPIHSIFSIRWFPDSSALYCGKSISDVQLRNHMCKHGFYAVVRNFESPLGLSKPRPIVGVILFSVEKQLPSSNALYTEALLERRLSAFKLFQSYLGEMSEYDQLQYNEILTFLEDNHVSIPWSMVYMIANGHSKHLRQV